jgi:hypothetical protein
MNIETIKTLEAVPCECGNEAKLWHEIVLFAPCHPGAGLTVRYATHIGLLIIRCHTCSRPAAVVQVATEEDPTARERLREAANQEAMDKMPVGVRQ